jgi:hypothetical protein
VNRLETSPEYVKGYSITLLCLGAFFLLGALQLVLFQGDRDNPSVQFISAVLCLLGFSCLTVSLLRWARLPAALPATEALSLLMFVAFPLGTIVSLYWLRNVRPREPIPEDDPWRARFRYTVALYIFGLMLLDAGMTMRFVLGSSGSEAPLLKALELGMFFLGLAAIAVGALRSRGSASF